jgi:hypothetical protein
MRTIYVARDAWHALRRPWIRPDARVARVGSVPRAAERLVGGAPRVNVA